MTLQHKKQEPTNKKLESRYQKPEEQIQSEKKVAEIRRVLKFSGLR